MRRTAKTIAIAAGAAAAASVIEIVPAVGLVASAECLMQCRRAAVIDARDDAWPHLLLWTDLNHDGVSQPNEIQHISVSGVTAIELAYHWTGRRDPSGNFFRYEGHVHLGHEVRPFYDIYFRSVP